MKYKVGDRVRIRSDLKGDKKYGSQYVNDSIENKKGEIVTIQQIIYDRKYYRIEEDGWNWTDEMFIGLADEVSCFTCLHHDEVKCCIYEDIKKCDGYHVSVSESDPQLKVTRYVKWEKREYHIPEPTKKVKVYGENGLDCELKDECENWKRSSVECVNNCKNSDTYTGTRPCPKFKQKEPSIESMAIVDDTITSTTDHTNDGWIPVDEALPKPLETVLITVKPPYDLAHIGPDVTDAYINARGWKPTKADWYYGNEEVIAWRPLPPAYIPPKPELKPELKPVWYQSIVIYEVTKDGRVKKSKLHQRVPDGEDAKRFAEMRLKHYMEKHSDKNVMARIIENLEYK